MTDSPSGGRPPAEKLTVAERRADLVKYRIAGRPYEEFYRQLGYASINAATKDFHRVFEESVAELHASREVYREIELARLDAELHRLDRLYRKVEQILDEQHITISNGRVILLDGATVPDPGPILQAADRLIRIEDARRRNGERRAKLLGLEAPQRLEVLTIDDIDAQIRALTEQLAATDSEAGTPEGAEAAPG